MHNIFMAFKKFELRFTCPQSADINYRWTYYLNKIFI